MYKFYLNNDENIIDWSLEGTQDDTLISAATGKAGRMPGFKSSAYIDVIGNYKMRLKDFITGAFYDASKTYISGMNSQKNDYIDVPKNAKYIRVSTRSVQADMIQVYLWRPTNPIYKSDLSKDYELESEQKFYRAKLSGSLSYLNRDYEYIMQQNFETQMRVMIFSSVDWGKTWQLFYKGKFMRTDCTINIDDRKVTVEPEVDDEYNDVIAGLEKEYNMMELAPVNQFLTIYKRPLIQIYVPGDEIVSCFIGGVYWEQSTSKTVTDINALKNTYRFAQMSQIFEIKVTGKNGAPNTYNGTYVGRVEKINEDIGNITRLAKGEFYNENANYKIVYDVSYQKNLEKTFESFIFYANNERLYLYNDYLSDPNKIITVDNYNGAAAGSLEMDIQETIIMARYLCDVTDISGTSTYPIPSDDIVDDNRNYRRVIGYAIDCVYVSNSFSPEPTKWGMADDGQYYKPPYVLGQYSFYPIARSTWRYTSIWFAFHFMDWALEAQARKKYTLRDTFTLASCINVLLQQFAPGITHEATPEYSQFLYSENGDPLFGNKFRLLVTQKSNILNGEYQTPAQKAPMTLQQITEMLRNTFKCYWYIEDGKFKIEHIQWFKNGGSYDSTGLVGLDLTRLINTRNGKPWSFNVNEYSYDKIELAERYQFQWMDDVTEQFKGQAVEILSKYVTAGKVEDINISNFTSDIDFMLLNPSEISSDGFALFAAVEPSEGEQYELPIVRTSIEGTTYYLQNGLLAFAYLLQRYWRYDMPAMDLKVNGTQTIALSRQRAKKQTVKFPAPAGEFDPKNLIKTPIGNGEIEKFSLTLDSQIVEATLKYDTK